MNVLIWWWNESLGTPTKNSSNILCWYPYRNFTFRRLQKEVFRPIESYQLLSILFIITICSLDPISKT